MKQSNIEIKDRVGLLAMITTCEIFDLKEGKDFHLVVNGKTRTIKQIYKALDNLDSNQEKQREELETKLTKERRLDFDV